MAESKSKRERKPPRPTRLRQCAGAGEGSERDGKCGNPACSFDLHRLKTNEAQFVYELMLYGVMVYIGASYKPRQRLSQHRVLRKIRTIELGEMVTCCSRICAAHVELEAIRSIEPEWNISGNEAARKARYPANSAKAKEYVKRSWKTRRQRAAAGMYQYDR